MTDVTQPGFPYKINGKMARTTDGTPISAQVLADAGFEPAEDFLLIERTEHGTRVVSSDDVLHLTGSNKEFFAFESGTSFEVTVNGHSIWWGHPKIEIEKIRYLGNVSDEEDLIWEHIDGENEVLNLHGHFDMHDRGIEHLKTRKRPYTEIEYIYFVDTVEYPTDQPELTGAQIMAKIPDWNPANSLVLEGSGDEADEVIRPTTVVVFKGREFPAHFTIVPPATFGIL